MKLGISSLAVVLLVAVASVVAAPSARAQPQSVTLNVTMHDGDGDYWFEVEGKTGRNPTLTLPAGANVTARVRNVGQLPHNFHVGDPVGKWTDLLEAGGEATLSFTIPGDAEGGDYWCDPHRSLGMEGAFTIQGGGDGTGGDDAPEESVGPTGSLTFLLAIAALGVSIVALIGVFVLAVSRR